jgi:hypothetical protein
MFAAAKKVRFFEVHIRYCFFLGGFKNNLKFFQESIVGVKKGFYICTRLRRKVFKNIRKSSLNILIDSVRN